MILGIFLTSNVGDLLLNKAFQNSKTSITKKFCEYITKHGQIPLCIELSGNYFMHVKVNDVYLVICYEDFVLSPFYLNHKLKQRIEVCTDLMGVFNEHNILKNIGMVCDVLTDILDSGEIHSTSYYAVWKKGISESQTLLSMLPANLFGSPNDPKLVASSDSSKIPLAQATTEIIDNESVYVDLIEEISIIVGENGAPLHSKVMGKMSVKSYLSQHINVLVNFASNLIYDQNKQDVLSTDTVLSQCQFSKKVNHTEFPKQLLISTEQGYNHALDYCVKDISFNLPFTLYNSITVSSEKSISIEFKFYCNTQDGFSPINFKASLPLPSNTISVSGKSSLHSIKFSHDIKNCLLSWSSELIASQSHHSVVVNIVLSDISPLTFLELHAVNLSFEIPSMCLSGVNISNVKIPNNTHKAIKKWARCLTHTKAYQFMLKRP